MNYFDIPIVDELKHPAAILNPADMEVVAANHLMKDYLGEDPTGGVIYDFITVYPNIEPDKIETGTLLIHYAQHGTDTCSAIITTIREFLLLTIVPEGTIFSIREYEYRQIMDHFPQAMFIANREGHVEYANYALMTLLGSPSLESTRAINIWESENLKASSIMDDMKKVLTTGEHVVSERSYTSHWGKKLKLRYYLYPIKYLETPEKIVGIVEHIPNSEDISHMNESLMLTQKLETLGLLAGGIAHDFNNLLTSLLGYIEDTRQYVPENSPAADNLNQMGDTVKMAADLIHQLLAFSRRQVLSVRQVDINSLVLSLKSMLERLIGENVSLILDLNDIHELWVEIDESQIGQVLVNLVVNARDAIENEGKIVIRTKHVKFRHYENQSQVPDPVTELGDSFVVISITDDGCGIPKDVLPHIFEPFFTTKKEKGTGLGLATSYGIIRQHGGMITVSSQEGFGTTFKIYLPMAKPETRSQDYEELDEEDTTPPPVTQVVIMFVEDEELIRKVTARYLRKQGYSVILASDGQEALEVARRATAIDIVVTDVVMPRMNGIEMVRRLKQIHPGVKVIYTSGYSDEMVGQHRTPDTMFIQKPYTPQHLIKQVASLLGDEYFSR